MSRHPTEHYEQVAHHGLTEATYLAVLEALAGDKARLGSLMADLHPADIADLLERLPRNARPEILAQIEYDHLGDVVAELEDGVQAHVLQLLRPEELRHALDDLESDDAAHLAQVVEDSTDANGPDAEDLLPDHQQKRLLSYAEDTAGGLMQLEAVTALPTRTVGEMLAFLREDNDNLPNNPGTVFVVNNRRKLLGTVSLHRLLKAPLTASLQDIMRKEPLTVHPEQTSDDVVRIFEKYDLHNLAVVNARGYLLGRITIDDVLDVVMNDSARRDARAVGLDESEDLFAPTLETTRQRLPWLVVNLGTAIAAAAVIAMFEASIAQLTVLAILMPIVASMGGNATTQTQTVIIRGLALGQITRQNALSLLRKEFMAGGYIGTLLALLMALGVWGLYGNPMLALVIALATVANHAIAALGGWLTPLLLKRWKYDPAIATGVITTTFTDVGGFFVFLGLATLLLL
jgi:magnesium transporter